MIVPRPDLGEGSALVTLSEVKGTMTVMGPFATLRVTKGGREKGTYNVASTRSSAA
jgi:hypothetical protein